MYEILETDWPGIAFRDASSEEDARAVRDELTSVLTCENEVVEGSQKLPDLVAALEASLRDVDTLTIQRTFTSLSTLFGQDQALRLYLRAVKKVWYQVLQDLLLSLNDERAFSIPIAGEIFAGIELIPGEPRESYGERYSLEIQRLLAQARAKRK